MSEAENIDTDLYATRTEAVQAALDTAEPGDTIVVCRGEWGACTKGREEGCEFCARIEWRVELKADEILMKAATS